MSVCPSVTLFDPEEAHIFSGKERTSECILYTLVEGSQPYSSLTFTWEEAAKLETGNQPGEVTSVINLTQGGQNPITLEYQIYPPPLIL